MSRKPRRQVAGAQQDRVAVRVGGDILGEFAGRAPEEDGDRAGSLIEDGQVEERVGVEPAGDDSSGTEPGGEGLRGLRVEKAAGPVALQHRETVGAAVEGDQFYGRAGVEVASDQGGGRLAGADLRRAGEIVQVVESGPGPDAQLGRERGRRQVQEDADIAGELTRDRDVQAAVAVRINQGDVGGDQAYVRGEVRG